VRNTDCNGERPGGGSGIFDAVLKAVAFDSGPPVVCDEPAATAERASDEHGRRGIAGATNRLNIGDKVRRIPGHCDPTAIPTLLSPQAGEVRVGACLHPRQPRRAALARISQARPMQFRRCAVI
jgi:hypothetical protein